MSDFIDANFPREVEFLKALVRVPSDNPPGDCARHAEAAARLLEGLGFKVERHPVPDDVVEAARHGVGDQSDRPRALRQRQGAGDRAQRPWRRGAAGQGWTPRSLRRGGTGRRDLRPRRRGLEIGFRDLCLRAAGAEGRSGRARRHGRTAPDLRRGDRRLRRAEMAAGAEASPSRTSRSPPASPTRSSPRTTACCISKSRCSGQQAHAAMPESGADALEAATGDAGRDLRGAQAAATRQVEVSPASARRSSPSG